MPTRCLVTGAAGFVGGHLVRGLLRTGHFVRTLDVLPLDDKDAAENVEHVLGDVRDINVLRRATADIGVVYHAAALVPLSRAGSILARVNAEGTRQVLEAALASGVGHVVYVSTSAVYGVPRRVPVAETDPVRPLGAYAQSKADGERLCRLYRTRGVRTTILRPCTIMGPGRLGIFDILFEAVHRGRGIFVLGDGRNSYQLVSARDFTEACLRLLDHDGDQDYNIGADDFGTVREDLSSLIAHAHSTSRIRCLPPIFGRLLLRTLRTLRLSPLDEWHHAILDRDLYLETIKARRLLGWNPVDSNSAALCQAFDWYAQNAANVHQRNLSPHRRGVRSGFVRNGWFW